ncbi:hypothetical protein F5Y15DRAFT_199104 [Xylariaceae sp. FL0016]|nr:hypothetical protein F5Y15DRAFT_199104 [Xylariaceae sp. FL0016]
MHFPLTTLITLASLASLATASQRAPRTAILFSAPASTSVASLVTEITMSAPPPTQTQAASSRLPGVMATASASAAAAAGTTDAEVPPASQITASPNVTLPMGGNFHELTGGVKFVQTTYYSCVTWPRETHCGWHEPILDAGAGSVRPSLTALRAGVLAGIVGSLVLVL